MTFINYHNMALTNYDDYQAGSAVLSEFGFTNTTTEQSKLPEWRRQESEKQYYQLRGDGYFGFDLMRYDIDENNEKTWKELIWCEPYGTDEQLRNGLLRHLTPLTPPA